MIQRLNERGKPVRLPKPCKECGALGHTRFTCSRRPNKTLRASKPMRKIGKVTKKWLQVRDKWLEVNKAEYYVCFYCPRIMTRSQLTLDHKLSRSRHPELRYDWHNLVPCCTPCNEAKGSLDADEYIEKLRRDNVEH